MRPSRSGSSHPQPLPRILLGTASLALAATLLLLVFPRITGAGWGRIWAAVATLTPGQLALLTGLWLIGVWVFSWVLTGALPGLTHGQAVVINLAGSAVSNVAPFGGALGVGVSYAMARSFGFPRASIASSVAVTGLLNVLAKLALPLLGLLALLASGQLPSTGLTLAAALGTCLLGLAVAAVIGLLVSDAVAHQLSRAFDACGNAVLRLGRKRPTVQSAPAVFDLRDRSVGLVRRRWRPMTVGLTGFLAVQALLLWIILRMLGGALGPAQVFAAFAFGRMLTAAVITPGGVGIAETGSAALLVAFGGDPAISAAATLLLSGYTYLIEIPAGGVSALIWWRRRSWRQPHDSLVGLP